MNHENRPIGGANTTTTPLRARNTKEKDSVFRNWMGKAPVPPKPKGESSRRTADSRSAQMASGFKHPCPRGKAQVDNRISRECVGCYTLLSLSPR